VTTRSSGTLGTSFPPVVPRIPCGGREWGPASRGGEFGGAEHPKHLYPVREVRNEKAETVGTRYTHRPGWPPISDVIFPVPRRDGKGEHRLDSRSRTQETEESGMKVVLSEQCL
jgi:hypothetical protein